MNGLQFRYLIGYIHFTLQGNNMNALLHECQRENILLWDLTMSKDNYIEGKAYVTNERRMHQIAEDLQVEMRTVERTGFIFILQTLWQQKEKFIAFLCASLFLFYLSHTVWKVEVNGVPTFVAHEIEAELQSFGIAKGNFRPSRASVGQIEAHIMETLPQLLYISVKKRGTIYTIDALEKQEARLRESSVPTDLIASKDGIIQKMLIKNGQAVVHTNDFVKKGDLLVTGEINIEDEKVKDDEEEAPPTELTTAEGQVYAQTWYEIDVSSQVQATYKTLQGEHVHHYFLSIGKAHIPLWIWPKIKSNEREVIDELIPLHLFNKELPIQLNKRMIAAKRTVAIEHSLKDAKEKGIEHALKDLQSKLGKGTEIVKYYVLHEVVDSGKVKLRLYVSVLENIAQTRPITIKDES